MFRSSYVTNPTLNSDLHILFDKQLVQQKYQKYPFILPHCLNLFEQIISASSIPDNPPYRQIRQGPRNVLLMQVSNETAAVVSLLRLLESSPDIVLLPSGVVSFKIIKDIVTPII